MLTTTAGSLRTKLPEVAGNPTGAGDAMVAIAARQLLIGASDRELLAQAVAAGSLAAAELVAGVIDFQRLEALAATAEIKG
jgi:tagatose 6-phosphate kinase